MKEISIAKAVYYSRPHGTWYMTICQSTVRPNGIPKLAQMVYYDIRIDII